MHIMCYHVLFFIQEHVYFKRFTGQGVVKNNNDANRVLFQKSNKWDAAKDIRFMESRQWELKKHEREEGTYAKRNGEYWDVETSRVRKKRRSIDEAHILQEADDDTADTSTSLVDYNSFAVLQLREEIKSKGYIQRGLAKLKKADLITLLESF